MLRKILFVLATVGIIYDQPKGGKGGGNLAKASKEVTP